MKIVLIVAAFLALGLTAYACLPKGYAATNAARVSATVIDSDLHYKLRKVCIDGISYLTYGESLVEQHTPDGKPRTCDN